MEGIGYYNAKVGGSSHTNLRLSLRKLVIVIIYHQGDINMVNQLSSKKIKRFFGLFFFVLFWDLSKEQYFCLGGYVNNQGNHKK